MKTQKAIIYDDNCPMCKWYTGAFVKTNLLESSNRISFSELSNTSLSAQIEMQRSKHEIPLVDLHGGETLYGVDSLVHLLQPKFPIIGKLMQVSAISYLVRKLYQFISYNRGVMAPSFPTYRKYDCTPDFHLGHRLALIILLGGLGGYLLHTPSLEPLLQSHGLWIGTMLLLFGLPFFKKLYISYLGHLSVTLFLVGFLVRMSSVIPLLQAVLLGISMMIFLWQFIRRYRILWAQMRWPKP